MRQFILTFSLLGLIIHLILLSVLNFGTSLVTEKTSYFISNEVSGHLNEEVLKIKSNKTFKAAKLLLKNQVNNIDLRLDSLELILKTEIAVLTKELSANKGRIKPPAFDTKSFDINKLLSDQEYMSNWLRFKYLKSLSNLKLELNIFLLTNLIVFLVLFIINVTNKQSDKIVLISLFSLIAIIISSLVYLFAQNWFYAIIFNSYFGYTYAFIFIMILGVLLDISFNKGKISAIIGIAS